MRLRELCVGAHQRSSSCVRFGLVRVLDLRQHDSLIPRGTSDDHPVGVALGVEAGAQRVNGPLCCSSSGHPVGVLELDSQGSSEAPAGLIAPGREGRIQAVSATSPVRWDSH